MAKKEYLFADAPISSYLDDCRTKIVSSIGNLSVNQLLPAEDETVCENFIAQNQIEPITLHEDALVLIQPVEVETVEEGHDSRERYRRKGLRPKSLTDAIHQLLGYMTWRESKAAILLFNRNRNFSGVLAQIPDAIKTHPQFVRSEPYDRATSFRFIVRHPHDTARHLTVTVLAFDVPSAPSTDA